PPPTPLAVNLGFDEGNAGEEPPGWRVAAQSKNAGFRTAIVGEPCVTGRCVRVERREERPGSSGTGVLAQRIDATPYRGHRIRLRGKLRSELTDLGTFNSTAQLWLRVDLPDAK